MRNSQTQILAEKQEQKNRKRMHLSGERLRRPSKHSGLKLIFKSK